MDLAAQFGNIIGNVGSQRAIDAFVCALAKHDPQALSKLATSTVEVAQHVAFKAGEEHARPGGQADQRLAANVRHAQEIARRTRARFDELGTLAADTAKARDKAVKDLEEAQARAADLENRLDEAQKQIVTQTKWRIESEGERRRLQELVDRMAQEGRSLFD